MTLSGGARSATIDLVAASDTIADGGETVILTLTSGTGPGTVVVDTTPATVTISDPRKRRDNSPPRANAGSDQTVNERTPVGLDGSNSEDDDSDFLTFSWTQTAGPDVNIDGANSQFVFFTAPEVTKADSPATLTFRLTVTDDQFSSDTDLVTVTVNHVNQLPYTIGSIGADTIARDTVRTIDASDYLDDPDTNEPAATYSATSSSGGSVVSVSISGSVVTYEGVALGSDTVTVTITDSRAGHGHSGVHGDGREPAT